MTSRTLHAVTMNGLLWGTVVLTFVATTSCAPLLATDPLIRGTVVDVGNGWLDVRHKSGRVVRVLITTSTDVTQGRAVARIACVRAGQRTMIMLAQPSGPFFAREVRVFGGGTC